MAEWLHWAVGNIPCPDFPEQKMPGIPMKSADLDVASSTVLMEYVGPSPPPGTGPHRYVLTLYLQPNGEMSFAVRSSCMVAGNSVESLGLSIVAALAEHALSCSPWAMLVLNSIWRSMHKSRG